MIQRGAKTTGENWRDNYQTPPYILDKVNILFGDNNWFDPFPVNPSFNVFMDLYPTDDIRHMYINPPFSLYSKAVDTLLPRKAEQIWILSNIKTETTYAQKLLAKASAICYLNKRVAFIDPRTGIPAKDNYCGQMLLYIGNDPDFFCSVFRTLGVTKYSYSN
jgi:hypothetical protein